MDEKKTAVPVLYRDINTITAEIRLIQENVQLYVSQATMKIGEKLTEANPVRNNNSEFFLLLNFFSPEAANSE